MILFGLTLLLIGFFLYEPKMFPYSLMLFLAFFDMFDGFYKDDKIFAAIRYVVPLALLAVYMTKYEVLKTYDAILLVVIAYLLVLLVVNAGDFLITARNVLSVIITLLLIPVGRHLGKTSNFLKDFEVYNRVLLMAIPVYIIAANVLHFGESYTDAFSTGFYITSRMYLVPIVVFLAIHYAISNKEKSLFLKVNDIGFILLNICILLINTRRTTLAMLLGAIFIYTLLNRQLIFKMVVLVLFTVAALVFSYPLYEAKLTAQLEKRERIQNLDTYEEEGRYLETLYIIDHFETKGTLRQFLFGVQLFDTHAFGTRYFGRDRPIHSDLNMLFYSTGMVGCLLFFILIVHYFLNGNRRISKHNKKIYLPILLVFLVVLIPGRFIGTLNFAPLLMLLLASIKAGRQTESEAEEDTEKENITYFTKEHWPTGRLINH